MTLRPLPFLAAFLLATAGCAAETKPMRSGGPPPPQRAAPAASPETAALVNKLVSLAGSNRSEDQSELARLLTQEKTLDQLDEPKVRDRARPSELRIAAVMSQLSTNPAGAQTLASVARSEPFNQSWQRQELAVRALAHQRPLLPDALAFLDAQTQPDSVNLHVAMEALCDNGSAPAVELFGKKLTDPKHEPEFKAAWLRDPFLRHRRDAALLTAAEKWLADSALGKELRETLAEALFDYQPDEWYPGRDGLPRPPEESATKADAATVLRRIAQQINSGDYPSSIKSAANRVTSKLPG